MNGQQMHQPPQILGNNPDAMVTELLNNSRQNYGNNLLSVDQYAQSLRGTGMPQQGDQTNTMSEVPNQMALQQSQLNMFRNIANHSRNSSILV